MNTSEKPSIKVLHIVNRFNLGGHVFKPLYLAKYLPAEYKTFVVGGIHTKEEESAEFLFNNEGVDYHIIPEMSRSINFLDDYKAYRKLKRIIKEFKPDIVHTHASKAGLLGRLAAYTSLVPVTIHTFHGHVFHSYFGWFKTSIFKNIERVLALKTTAIIAVSRLQQDDLCQRFKIVKASKTHVIPIGLDLEKFHTNMDQKRNQFREKYRIADNEIVVSIIGRLVPIKNHHLFIDAISELKTLTNKKVKALIVGDGDLQEELMQYAQNQNISTSYKGIDGEMIFTSWIKNVDEVYAGSDIIALTSHNEGTPVAIIEAQVAQKAIVTTNAGGTSDILMEDRNHKIVKKEAKDFAQNLNDILDNLKDNSELNSVAQQETLGEFSYQTMVERMNILYKTLLKL